MNRTRSIIWAGIFTIRAITEYKAVFFLAIEKSPYSIRKKILYITFIFRDFPISALYYVAMVRGTMATLIGGICMSYVSIDNVRGYIIGSIVDGTFPVGSIIPELKNLADSFRVSRDTVLSAIKRLIDEGILESHAQAGFVVIKNPADAMSTDIEPIMPYWIALRDRIQALSFEIMETCQSKKSTNEITQCIRMRAQEIVMQCVTIDYLEKHGWGDLTGEQKGN